MKPVTELTASELQRAYARESARGSELASRFIAAGRGHERPSDARAAIAAGSADPLTVEYVAHLDAFSGIVDEMRRRERWHGSLKRILPKKK